MTTTTGQPPTSARAAASCGRAAAAGVDVAGPVRTGDLVVDLARYAVSLGDRDLDLSPRQVELLALFLAAPRRVWSRDQLHWVCWGDTTPSRRVDVQLCRLRARPGWTCSATCATAAGRCARSPRTASRAAPCRRRRRAPRPAPRRAPPAAAG